MSTTARQRPVSRAASLGASWIAGAGLACFLLVASLLVARRLAHALTQPLPAWALLAVAVALAAAATGVRRAVADSQLARRQRLAFHTGLSAAVLGIGISLWLPGTPAPAMGLFLAALLVGEIVGWTLVLRGPRRTGQLPIPRHSPTRGSAPVDMPSGATIERPDNDAAVDAAAPTDKVDSDFSAGLPSFATPEAADTSVAQQLTRRRTAEGADELTGWIHVEFAPGQRTENAHVAFCPAFAGTPRLEVEQVAGPTARVKTAQVLAYGARLDLKLTAPSVGRNSVTLRLAAVSS